MKEIDLAPFEGPLRTVRGVHRARLHALHVADMMDWVNGAVAVVIAAA